MVVDGDVDVCCENFLAQPNEGCGLTVAVLNGTLRTDLLRWRNGDMLIAGGVMTARSISTFNPITVTCRDGVLLLDWPSDYEMTFVLSGGEAYLAGPLNEGTVVEAGAGILAAQDVSAAEIHGDGASVLGGEEAESWYFQTTYSEDWSGAQDGMTWDALTLADAGGGWFAGTLTMENVTAEELLPWGALWLRLAGENTVSGEVGGTGLLVEGDGAISAGNLNLWGWGGIHHPAFALRGATVTTGGFGMGCNSGEAGTFEVSGGSFTCTGETWMQNAAMTVLDGEVRFDGPCNLDSGSVVIEGGTVVFAERALARERRYYSHGWRSHRAGRRGRLDRRERERPHRGRNRAGAVSGTQLWADTSEVRRKTESLNPLSHGFAMTAPLDAIKGSLFPLRRGRADRVVRPYMVRCKTEKALSGWRGLFITSTWGSGCRACRQWHGADISRRTGRSSGRGSRRSRRGSLSR